MKKIALVIILSMLSLSMSISQTKYGVGFEFHTMPSVLLANQGATQSLGVYIPINTATLLIEPLVMYSSSTLEIDYDNSDYGDSDYSESDLTCIMDNYNIVNDKINSKIKEKLILSHISHNMLTDEKNDDECRLIYKTINNFINKF